ncbi:MAG: SURF1 family protein [Pseudomonadota bacterium]
MSNLAAHFNRPRPVPLLMSIVFFGVCVAAGSWQLDRLRWKEQLIADVASAHEKPPLTALPADDAALSTMQFANVTLRGTWVPGVEFHLAPRYWRDQFGYALISPFKLADGRLLLVNRGWVPGTMKLAEKRPTTAVKGPATIRGMVRVGPERGTFTPVSQPEKNIWFGRDIADMAAHANLKNVMPVMVDLVGTQDIKHLPIPSDGTIRLRNDHLGYVFTWWGIALGILVIFVTYHHKKR